MGRLGGVFKLKTIMKKIYQSPSACAYKITGRKAFVQTSIKLGNSEEKVTNSTDIGFAKEENTQSNNNVWDEEW